MGVVEVSFLLIDGEGKVREEEKKTKDRWALWTLSKAGPFLALSALLALLALS